MLGSAVSGVIDHATTIAVAFLASRGLPFFLVLLVQLIKGNDAAKVYAEAVKPWVALLYRRPVPRRPRSTPRTDDGQQ
jgi:hypothetical protein